ncbi:MAG TPA: ArsC/Spx/MgsR family protein [Mangrovimonas sp.]|nr:ArsC/Spx/MgsR family protein [Mangrovimonas sp.]
MKKIYYLKTCSTCVRILRELNPNKDVILQDIKEEPITVKQLDEMKALADTYEALFSKRAKLYKEMGLKDVVLKESDFKQYILEHYTFLSRPVVIVDSEIFIGNAPKTVAAAKQALNG